jgi:hypothetical protein
MADLTSMLSGLTAKAGSLFGKPPAPAPTDATDTPAADPYSDTDAILERVRKFKEEFGKRDTRDRFLRPMYRNVLFYRSIQWIRWDLGSSRWRPANIPKHIPTPVTNVFADTMDTVNAVFGRIEPTLNWRPGSPDEPADRATADVAARAIQVIEDEVSIRMNRQSLATWVGFTGGAFLETGYDPDPIHGTRQIPMDQCPSCDHTQPQGAMACEGCGDTQPTPIQQTVPVGKMFIEVAPLFEMYFDPSITDFTKHRRLLREKCLSVDDAKERWPDFADSVSPDVSGTAEEHYMTALAIQGPALDERGTGRRDLATSGISTNNRVTERWYWELPSATYPDGLLAIVVGGSTLVYGKKLPYAAKLADGGLRPFLPFTWFPQKLVPGTFWPKTVADDVALLQTDRNKWQSALMLCGMRMGMPIWLRPRGANVAGLTQGGGEAGAVLDYNALGPGNAKPERIPGQPLPMSFLEYIAQIDASIEKLAKTFDILKGARPEGVSAGIALQILQERGLSAYGPLFIMWETGWAHWADQAIEIFRQYATEERLLKIKGRDGQWQVEKFIGADLQGRVDVIAEAGSSTPRSTLADRAEIEQLMMYGVVNPRDPETQGKILALYNKTDWLESMTRDAQNAIMEDEVFDQIAAMPLWQHASPEDVQAIEMLPDYPSAIAMMAEWQARVPQAAGQQPIPWPKVRPASDGHAIHVREHGIYAKSQSVRQYPDLIQAMVDKHVAYHNQLLIQQAAAVQGGQPLQGGFTQPAPGGVAPQRSPMNSSSSPQRMQGDQQEMGQDMSATGGL